MTDASKQDQVASDAAASAAADELVADPSIPAELDERGRAVWERIVPPLRRAGRLKTTDLEAVTRYCDLVGVYWKLSETISAEGETMKVPTIAKGEGGEVSFMWRRHPLLSERRAVAKSLEGIEDRFGMSPRARADLVNKQLGRGSAMLPGELPLQGGGESGDDRAAPDPADFN